MAIYKLKRRISETSEEEIKIPYSQIDSAPNVDNFVDLTSEQTISGVKRFNNTNGIYVDRIHNSNGNAIYDYDGTNIRIGGLTKPLHFRGSLARPKYMMNNGTLKDVALSEDIPTKTSDISNDSFVSYNAQTLSDSQKSQARTNIGAVSESDTVAEASKLETPRNISVGTAVSSTPTAFDGSKEIEIPINSVKEAYLAWGGKSISGVLTPIDCAMSPLHHNNVFAYANPAGIKVEYSNDGGATWLDYGATDEEKVGWVTGLGNGFYIGKKTSSKATVDDQLRVTLTSNTVTGNMGVYCSLLKLLIYVSINGASGSRVLIERSTIGDDNTFLNYGTYNVSGWSGWNSIYSPMVFGGSSAQTMQFRRLRLTFSITGVSSTYNSNLAIRYIQGLAQTVWNSPSNMASRGHLYSYDTQKNASFPAKVCANSNELLATEDFVGTKVTEAVKNGTLTIRQGGAVKGTFSANQAENSTIDLESSAGVSIVELNSTASSGTMTDEQLALLEDPSTLILHDGYYYQKIFFSSETAMTDVYANTTGGTNPYTNGANVITTRRILINPQGGWRYAQSVARSYRNATTSAAGLMSADDKTKLDGIAEGATANNGTITGITMNGASKGTSGVVDLGSVALPSDIKNPTITIQQNGTAIGSFTLNQSTASTININTLLNNIQYTSYGSCTSSFRLAVTNAKYLRIATGKVQTTSEITISLPTGANYYYIGYWTSPYANSSATNYSNSISGYMPSTTTSRGIATIKASSSGTAPFLFIYWQPL